MDVRVLHLTLKKEWFDLMISGKKRVEYRKPSKWIISRLEKEYDVIRFTNGYGSDKPYFVCEYKGFEISKKSENVYYSAFSNTAISHDSADIFLVIHALFPINLESLRPMPIIAFITGVLDGDFDYFLGSSCFLFEMRRYHTENRIYKHLIFKGESRIEPF